MSEHTVQLIEIVKRYPVLYDSTHKNYKNSKFKNKIWSCIALEIQEDDIDVIKARWKNLRDSYGKHLRSHYAEARQVSKYVDRYKSWPWGKQMAFLQPFLETNTAQSNNLTSSKEFEIYTDQSGTTSEIPGSTYQKGAALQHVSVQYQDPPTEHPSCHTQSNQHRPREPQFDDAIGYYNNITEYDETDLIFLGYSKTIKKMSLRRQALIKFNIAKLIMEAEIEHDDETSTQNNTNKTRSLSVNGLTDRNNSPQECYTFHQNYEETEDFSDLTETKVELHEFDQTTSGSDPLLLASPPSCSQQNYHSDQKNILPITMAEDMHVTYSQPHSSFASQRDNKVIPSSKKVKLRLKESDKKS